MFKLNHQQIKTNKKEKGFNVAEVAVTTAIIGTLGSVAYPTYVGSQQRAKCAETEATLVSIAPIIGSFIDTTGEIPTTWDDLSSIAVVMTSSGPATGALNIPIILPRTNHELSIEGPDQSTYSLTANCYIKTVVRGPENKPPIEGDPKGYTIRSCFNISNGASDLKRGINADDQNTPNCG